MKKKIVKAVILAAGFSRRIKSAIPKQLVEINKKPLLAYTLDAFEKTDLVDSIILVTQASLSDCCGNLVKKYGYQKVEQICLGGATRQQSVFNALNKIGYCDYVIIHDGVRPFLTTELIMQAIKAVKKFSAVTLAVKATDTMVEADRGFIRTTLPRNKLWRIQTPQAFSFSILMQAHQQARRKGVFDSTDDAQLLLNSKKKVKLIPGSYQNLKITTASDLDLAKKLLT